MKEKICLMTCLLIAFLVAGCTQTQTEQDFQSVEVHSAEDVMQNVREDYDFIKGIKGTVVSEGETQEYRYNFWLKKDGFYKYKVDFEDYGTRVSNGSLTLMYNTPFAGSQLFFNWNSSPSVALVVEETFSELNRSQRGVRSRAPQQDTYTWIKLMPEDLNLSLSGEEKVAGRDCYVVEGYKSQNQTEELHSSYWVDKEYYYPLKVQMVNLREQKDNVSPSRTIWYESIEFNPTIDDSEFEFQIPDDVKHVGYCENYGDIYRMNCNWKEPG